MESYKYLSQLLNHGNFIPQDQYLAQIEGSATHNAFLFMSFGIRGSNFDQNDFLSLGDLSLSLSL